jgi:hypothetical protein
MMKRPSTKYHKLIGGSCLAAGLLCAAAARAGTAEYDFNTDPIAEGLMTFFGVGYWNPADGASGAGDDGYLVVTEGTGQSSRIIFNDFDGGKVVKAFTFEADFRIGNGSESPADGFSVSFARAGDPVIDAGTWAGGQNCEASLAEEGTQTGIAIGFDAWNSGGTAGSLCNVADQSIGPDVAALTVRVDGTLVAQFPLPTRNGACDNVTSLQTGAWDGSGDPSALCWAKLKVELLENAQLNVWWKGKQMLTNYQTDYFPSPGVLVFGGRTGDAWQNQHVDNIKISTIVEEADTEKPTTPANIRAVSTGAGRVELAWDPSTDNSGRVAYEVQRDGKVLTSVLQTTSFVDHPGQTGKQYTYTVRATDITPNYSDAATLQVTTAADARPVAGTLKVEIFDGITGTALADLTGNAKFAANTPDRAAYIGSLQAGNPNGTAGWNESFGNDFGLRITGVLTPLETADYDIFIRSDDASAFYLNQSGASLPDPLVDVALIEETGCCAAFLEPVDGDPATTATPVHLTAGQSYGFVILMKEGGGGDGVAVGMRKAGDPTLAANVPPVAGGLQLAGSGDPVGAVLNFTTQPGNRTVIANERLTLSGAVTNFSYYTSSVWYQWLRDGKPIGGATAPSYTIPVVSTADNGATFSLAAGTLGIAKTSSIATITVSADTKKPLVAKVAGNETMTAVDVIFSEPVTAPTATAAANYTFDNGLTASAATPVDQFTVRLTTSPQNEGALYTLTVNNVADNAGNAIAAGSTYTWKSFSLIPSRAKMEIWSNIQGTALQGLFDDPNYQAGTPDTVIYTAGLNTPDRADNYGAKVSGFLIPKESGSYHLFLYSDDASELYLSNNDVFPTVPGATPIAQETDCCDVYVEPGTMNDDTVTSATTATPVALAAGTRYAIVGMLKEGGGGDYLRAAMRKVGDTNVASALSPMSDVIYWYGPDANVLAPGNEIVATSTNSPAAERAPLAIDGNPATKYLNFDKLNAGFTVDPARATTVRGLGLTSANDAPERDPASFEVWGSVDGNSFVKIAEGAVPAFPDRFIRREVYFANDAAYTTYKVLFPTVANAATANSMQIADVELLGYTGGRLAEGSQNVALSVTGTATGDLVLTFEGTLESTDNLVGGTWTTVSTTSPATVSPTGAMKFFRARQ